MIYIIRHTKKEQHGSIPEGQSYLEYTKGVPLTAEGELHAERIADFLSVHANIQSIVASPYKRTLQTATIIGDLLDVPVKIDDNLRERELCSGSMSMEEIYGYNENSLRDWGWSAPGGESMDTVFRRFKKAFDASAKPANRDVLLVSHSRAIQAYAGNVKNDKKLGYRSADPRMIIPSGFVLGSCDGVLNAVAYVP